MGFAAEIVFVLRLGLLIFGPKRLRATLGGVVQTADNFEEV
jgi:Sec-independent protein translocase protein TatA